MLALAAVLVVGAAVAAFAPRLAGRSEQLLALRASAGSLAVVSGFIGLGGSFDVRRGPEWALACALGATLVAWRRPLRVTTLAAASAAQAAGAVVVLAVLHVVTTKAPSSSFVLGVRAIGVVAVATGALAATRRGGASAWIALMLAVLGITGASLATMGAAWLAPGSCVIVGVVVGEMLHRLPSLGGARGAWLSVAAIIAGIGASAAIELQAGLSQGVLVGVALFATGTVATAGRDISEHASRTIAVLSVTSLALVAAFAIVAGFARCEAWIASEALPSVDRIEALGRCHGVGAGWLAPDPSATGVVAAAALGVFAVTAQCAARMVRIDRARLLLDAMPALAVASLLIVPMVEAETIAAFVLALVVTSTCAALVLSYGPDPAAAHSLAVSTMLCAATAAAFGPLSR